MTCCSNTLYIFGGYNERGFINGMMTELEIIPDDEKKEKKGGGTLFSGLFKKS
jgi:hypothetical protein